MKVVIDTNVLISGIFYGGVPGEILQRWRRKEFHLMVSMEIVNEYNRVATILSKKFPRIDLDSILNFISLNAEYNLQTDWIEPICTDRDDDKFVICAIKTHANYLISGDKHLHAVNGYFGINVVRPREFLDYL